MAKVGVSLQTIENGRIVTRTSNIDIDTPGAILTRCIVAVDGLTLVNIGFAMNEWTAEWEDPDLDAEPF